MQIGDVGREREREQTNLSSETDRGTQASTGHASYLVAVCKCINANFPWTFCSQTATHINQPALVMGTAAVRLLQCFLLKQSTY